MSKKTRGILKKDGFVCKLGKFIWSGIKWYGGFLLGLGKILLEGASDLTDAVIASAKSDTAPKKDKKKEKGDGEHEKE